MKQMGMSELRWFDDSGQIYWRVADVFGDNIEWFHKDLRDYSMKRVSRKAHINLENEFKQKGDNG